MSEGAPGNSSGSEATHATNEVDDSPNQYEQENLQAENAEQANGPANEAALSSGYQSTANERDARIAEARNAVDEARTSAFGADAETAATNRMPLTREDVSELQRLFPRLNLDVNNKDQAKRVNKVHTVLGALMNSSLVENQEVTSDLLRDNDNVSGAELDLFMPSQDEVDKVRKNAASVYDERHVSSFNETEFIENRAESEFDATLKQLSRAGVLEYDIVDGAPSYYVTAELESWINDASLRHEGRVKPVEMQHVASTKRSGVRKLMHGNKNDLSVTDAFKVIGLRGARLLPGMRVGAIHREHVVRNNATVRKVGLREFSQRTESQREGDKILVDPDRPRTQERSRVSGGRSTRVREGMMRAIDASIRLDAAAAQKAREGVARLRARRNRNRSS